MAVRKIESRVAMLEARVQELERDLKAMSVNNSQTASNQKGHWVDKVAGAFADDPDFLEAMRLGRKYR